MEVWKSLRKGYLFKFLERFAYALWPFLLLSFVEQIFSLYIQQLRLLLDIQNEYNLWLQDTDCFMDEGTLGRKVQ